MGERVGVRPGWGQKKMKDEWKRRGEERRERGKEEEGRSLLLLVLVFQILVDVAVIIKIR